MAAGRAVGTSRNAATANAKRRAVDITWSSAAGWTAILEQEGAAPVAASGAAAVGILWSCRLRGPRRELAQQLLDGGVELRIAAVAVQRRVGLDLEVGLDAGALDEPLAAGGEHAARGDTDRAAVDQPRVAAVADQPAP